ncbi:MAG TPA: DNA-3-methyladenine glycosylase [Bacteroidales bacterium]|nr:DNA-3-methyladenine glycosylase [Bacteroidales bacterium]
MKPLPAGYYLHPDVEYLARDLLGKLIMTKIEGDGVTGGIITETEVYKGETDRASHAFGGRRTARTETMYMQGGVAYVYLCYGVHHLFNVVTNMAGIPHAVLIRGIEPLYGREKMAQRLNLVNLVARNLSGPGKLTKALGIDRRHDKTLLTGSTIWIEDIGVQVKPEEIASGPRIGVAYAGEHAMLELRYRLVKNTSRG